MLRRKNIPYEDGINLSLVESKLKDINKQLDDLLNQCKLLEFQKCIILSGVSPGDIIEVKTRGKVQQCIISGFYGDCWPKGYLKNKDGTFSTTERHLYDFDPDNIVFIQKKGE